MTSPDSPPSFGPAPPPPFDLVSARRLRLLEAMGGGVAIIPAAPELLKSRDTEIRYRAGSDLFYFTGFTEPEAVAVLGPPEAEAPFTLFVRERDPEREIWVGERAGVEVAGGITGANAVHPISELPKRLPELVRGAHSIHYPVGASGTLDTLVRDTVIRVRRTRQRSGVGPTSIGDLEAIVGPLRLIKDDDELHRLRTAARISVAAHRAAAASVAVGKGEWEVQAELEAVMRRFGADGPSFPSIVASGPNATTLHYVDNRRILRDGELVLIDAGAEWGMYCGDITRTLPVSGRFTPEQRDLYELVLASQRAAIETVKPGAAVGDLHSAVVRVLTEGMMDLGILPRADIDEAIAAGAFRRFYMHQSSHWLGLDVHDAGPYTLDAAPIPLRPGMVLTIEPGLYIPPSADDVAESFRGLGVRIEDDLLVTVSGVEVLTEGAPVAPAEVEELVLG